MDREEVVRSVGVTLYVGNLPWALTEDDVSELFSRLGEVQAVRIITDRDTGRSRGFGFVEIEGVGIQEAIEAMDGVELRGRRLKVGPGKPRPERH